MNLVPLNTISGYEDIDGYFVSETGDIWSLRKKEFLTKLNPGIINGNKAIWIGPKNQGIGKRRKRRCLLVGNLVAKAFLPNLTNSKRVCYLSGDRMDCSVNNLSWEREKKIKERTGIEKDVIMLDDDIIKSFKKIYEAMKIKGYPVPTSTEFINSFLEDAMENYINKYGLRKILYQMDNQ